MKIAINGFGRIGRIFFRQAVERPNFEVVAINDLADKENLLYLLEHDSVYGSPGKTLGVKERSGKTPSVEEGVKFFQEKDPAKLPWKDLGVDIVIESTGFFTTYEKAKAHLEAGAKRVVISAPAKTGKTLGVKERSGKTPSVEEVEEVATLTPNVGVSAAEKSKITSNASCTTNAVAPVVAIMSQNPGIKKAVLNTVHGYTASQGIVDKPDAKDWRRGRAAALSIVPSSTGAALATAKAIPEMAGKFDGVAMRVPVPAGSLIDFTFLAEKPTTVEEINKIFKEAAEKPEWQGIMKVNEVPLVSADILGEPFGSIIDLNFTRVIDGDLVKIFSWYDNEWGYCAMLIKHIEALKHLL